MEINTLHKLENLILKNEMTPKQISKVVETAIGVYIYPEYLDKALLVKRIRDYLSKWPLGTEKENPLFMD
ncbi:MAG: hypothetical protein AAF090_16015 [Bacteroidota bacterium]